MQRVIELCVKIPEIVLTHWFPDEQDALSFPLDKIKGTITLNLDPESVKVLDYEIDDDGEQYPISYGCNSVLVRIEGQMSESKTEREFLNEICELAVEYINRLLSFFRNEMGQYWINLLHIHKGGLSWFLTESGAKWVDESGTTKVTIGGITVPPGFEQADFFYRHVRESEIDEQEWKKIRDFIKRGESSDLAKRLIVNAEQHFADGDLRMATVEAIAAFEVGLPSFVQERLESKHIAFRKYISNRELYAYDYVVLLLPLTLQAGELDDWMMHHGRSRHPELFIHVHHSRKSADEAILDTCKKLNAVRNNIVHGGKKKVKKYYEPAREEVEQGIEAIRGLLDFIEYAKGDF
jgi:hypothetical protein